MVWNGSGACDGRRNSPRLGNSFGTPPCRRSLLGHEDEARAAVARLLAVEPGYTIATDLARFPQGAPEKYAQYYEGLRRAGIPE